jgi:hypothetical protein
VVATELGIGLVNWHVESRGAVSVVVENVRRQQLSVELQNKQFWTCWSALAAFSFDFGHICRK